MPIRFLIRLLAVATTICVTVSARAVAQEPGQPLTLQQAIALGQRQGYQARSAENVRTSARERNSAFHAGYLPSLSVSGTTPSYNRSITPVLQPDGSTLYIPLQQTDASLLANITQKIPWTNSTVTVSSGIDQYKVTGPTGYTTWSSTPFVVGISQPLLRSNSQAWDLKQQDLSLESSERRYLETREDVAINVTNAFFDYYIAGLNLKNSEANLGINDTLYTLNKGRLEIGKIGENDLLQSQLALLRSQQSREDASLAYHRAKAAFQLAVNLPTSSAAAITMSADVPAFEADTAAAVHWARINSSAINDARASEVQGDREVSEARWNSGVGGTVTASYGFNATGTRASEAYQNLLGAQHLSLSVQMPLWQWGAHTSGIAAAEADRASLRDNADLNRAQVDQTAYFAALQLTQARRSLVIATKADTVAEQRFDVAYNRYVIGRITIDNLYIAQSEKDQALQAYTQALRSYWISYYQLRRNTLFDFEANQPIRE
ncbi:MAG TPA: TolC family protein [Gemmatimonadales bacterium]|jgi:outer membrane protein TolC